MDNSLTAIIVDDEQKARNILESLLAEHCNDIKVIATASNVPEALKEIHSKKPNVVFLDIEMPGYTGFQLLEMIPDPAFQVVFTTAYSEYALKAFEVSAIDYLLKPIRIQKLIDAVEKLKRYRPNHHTKERLSALRTNMNNDGLKKLTLPVADGYIFLDFSEIEYLEAEGSYARIHKTDGTFILVSKILRDLESQLSGAASFLRCHRSYIVNTRLITKWVKSDGGSIVLKSGKEVPLNKESKETLMQLLSTG